MTDASARVLAHARWELRLLLRNGEQLLLMVVIPLVLLVSLSRIGDIDTATPTVLATSVLATCFTSLAIGTGFERRSGALAFLGTTPLTRVNLMTGKFLATVILTILAAVVSVVAGLLLGWTPNASVPGAVLIVVLGGAAASAWAVLMAGALRAEAVLALANGLFVLLVAFGGVVVPASSFPGVLGTVVALLPSAALADGLRASLLDAAIPLAPAAILAAWAVAGALLARRWFRWD